MSRAVFPARSSMNRKNNRGAGGLAGGWLLAAVALFLFVGCSSVYRRHGYGENAFYRNPVSPTSIAVHLPANAPSISQQFNPAPREGALVQGVHNGIDLFVPTGTAVLAPADGTVVEVSHSFAYGNIIVIDHGRDRQGRRLRTRYLHLDQAACQERRKSNSRPPDRSIRDERPACRLPASALRGPGRG